MVSSLDIAVSVFIGLLSVALIKDAWSRKSLPLKRMLLHGFQCYLTTLGIVASWRLASFAFVVEAPPGLSQENLSLALLSFALLGWLGALYVYNRQINLVSIEKFKSWIHSLKDRKERTDR